MARRELGVMKTSLKIALFLGVVTALCGAGYAQMEGPEPSDGPMQGLTHDRARLADRLLADFDKNHDGKVTHDEMNRAIYARFMAATHGAQTMNEDQFAASHQDEFRDHATQTFRRIDWSGRGSLTLEDYAAPQRARFMAMDKDGSGTVPCGRSFPRYGNNSETNDGSRKSRYASRSTGGRGGVAAFCAANDLNQDGKVTRDEFDAAIVKRFSAATNGARTMSLPQYLADQEQDFRDGNARAFKRLDKDRDGKLSLAEFAAPELKLFARLDKNHDGVLTQDEMKSGSRSKAGGKSKRGYY
jgi:Ca2+-binding EF-hand superfamily protein